MWSPGTDLVYVGHKGSTRQLRIGQRVVVIFKSPDQSHCPVHGPVQVIRVAPYTYKNPWVGHCPHCFREPINLKAYFNLQQTEPVDGQT